MQNTDIMTAGLAIDWCVLNYAAIGSWMWNNTTPVCIVYTDKYRLHHVIKIRSDKGDLTSLGHDFQ